MLKRLLLSLPLLFLAPMLACAQDATWVEGTHYDVINPAIRTAEPEEDAELPAETKEEEEA